VQSYPHPRAHTLQVLYDPIPATMLEVYTGSPAAVVRSNGVTAACVDAEGATCAFNYNDELTPRVTSVSSLTPEPIVAGATLVISGTGLQASGGGSATVTFGGSPCDITTHTPTQIECTVSHTTTGTYVPVVIVDETGLANTSDVVSGVLYGYAVTSISPLESGHRGGTRVTLVGTGFSRDATDGVINNVTIGGKPCVVVSDPPPQPDRIVCIAPPSTDTSVLATTAWAALPVTFPRTVVVGLFGDYAYPDGFFYSRQLTPSVLSVSPSELRASVTTQVFLEGSFVSDGFTEGAPRLASLCASTRIASHRIASHRVALHCIASRRIALHRIASSCLTARRSIAACATTTSAPLLPIFLLPSFFYMSRVSIVPCQSCFELSIFYTCSKQQPLHNVTCRAISRIHSATRTYR
jgi:hypothetical protein